jgi:hypothetical protein
MDPSGQLRFHPLATTSLVTGIVAMVLSTACCCLGGFSMPIPIVALVCGILGLGKIKANPQIFKGNGFCIAGLTMGAVALILHLLAVFSTIDDQLKSQYGTAF